MIETMRYVTRRIGARGKVRWYWQRRGFPLTRLPDERVDRVAMVDRLNNQADATATGPVHGSIGWIIDRYRASDAYIDLSPSTKRHYDSALRDIEALGAALPFASFTRRAVVDFVESYKKNYQRQQAVAVLRVLFNRARYEGLVVENAASSMNMKRSRPRDRLWSEDEIERWLTTAADFPAFMTIGFRLLQYTAQRPIDVLQMHWHQYSGSAIRVRQQKTGVLLDVPVHPDLRAHLDQVRRAPVGLTIVANSRGLRARVAYKTFNDYFLEIVRKAGIDGAQARDLRRTAMINMAKGGATTPQIASVSGHSIEAAQRILETYLPRNRDLAEIAVARIDDGTKSNALDK
jgi:integrase